MKKSFQKNFASYQNAKKNQNNDNVNPIKYQKENGRKQIKSHNAYKASKEFISKDDKYGKVKSKLVGYAKNAHMDFANFKSFIECKYNLIAYTNSTWYIKAKKDYTMGFEIPKKDLDKDGIIKESRKLSLVMKLSKIESLRNKYPFYLKNMQRDKIVTATKTPIWQMNFSSDHKEDTEHHTVRQLLTCTVDNNQYLLSYDTTFYRGLPKTTSRLTLFMNGHTEGSKQLLRLDSCGMFDEDFLVSNHIDYKIPKLMKDLYRSSHNNLINTHNQEFYKPTVNTSTHLHSTDSDFDLYAAAFHMCFQHNYSNDSRKLGNELSKYNCREIEIIKNPKEKLEVAQNNNGVIPFAYLEKSYLNEFGLKNCGLTSEFIEAIEEYRKPNSKIDLSDFKLPIFKNTQEHIDVRKYFENHKFTSHIDNLKVVNKSIGELKFNPEKSK